MKMAERTSTVWKIRPPRVEQWAKTGTAMEAVRREELLGMKTVQALRNFTRTVLAELHRRLERISSGLVE